MTLQLPRRRKDKDRLVDLLLVLCTAAKVAQLGKEPGSTTTQKVFFWANIEAGATHHSFVRYNFGPFSPELRDDRAWLVHGGMLHSSNFAPTTRGAEVAQHWRKILEPANKSIFAALDASATKRAGWSAERAKREAYALKVTDAGVETTLEKLAQLHPLPIRAAEFRCSDSEAEDIHLDLSMNEASAARLKTAGRSVVEFPSLDAMMEAVEA